MTENKDKEIIGESQTVKVSLNLYSTASADLEDIGVEEFEITEQERKEYKSTNKMPKDIEDEASDQLNDRLGGSYTFKRVN